VDYNGGYSGIAGKRRYRQAKSMTVPTRAAFAGNKTKGQA